jgi:hypothetical protein
MNEFPDIPKGWAEFPAKDRWPEAECVVGFYNRSPWSDEDLVRRIELGFMLENRERDLGATARDMLEQLGSAGRSLLDQIPSKQAEPSD